MKEEDGKSQIPISCYLQETLWANEKCNARISLIYPGIQCPEHSWINASNQLSPPDYHRCLTDWTWCTNRKVYFLMLNRFGDKARQDQDTEGMISQLTLNVAAGMNGLNCSPCFLAPYQCLGNNVFLPQSAEYDNLGMASNCQLTQEILSLIMNWQPRKSSHFRFSFWTVGRWKNNSIWLPSSLLSLVSCCTRHLQSHIPTRSELQIWPHTFQRLTPIT